MKKRIVAITLAMIMVFGAVGCSSTTEKKETQGTEKENGTVAEKDRKSVV